MEISQIKPYEKNIKKHPAAQLYKIALSLRDFGWRQPIVVDKDGYIIVGHGRWFAYQQYKDTMNLSEPRIEVAEDLNEEQTRAYRLADNLVASTDYDAEMVLAEMQQLGLPFQEMLEYNPISETKKEKKQDQEFITDEGYLDYLNQSIRQIVLHYEQTEYTELIAKCDALIKQFELENNVALFKKLVEESYANTISTT